MFAADLSADLTLVGAILFGILMITSALSAWVEGTFPRRTLVYAAIAGGLGYLTMTLRPDGVQLEDVPLAFMHLVGLVIR